MAIRMREFPLGVMTLIADEGLLCHCGWGGTLPALLTEGNETDRRVLDETERQLREYFDGKRRHFDLPLHIRGTEFQVAVWSATTEIPYGFTTSYGEIADAIGRPGAARAVGSAMYDNPLNIIIPCHRVIKASGAVGNYVIGEDAKKSLLALETQQTEILL